MNNSSVSDPNPGGPPPPNPVLSAYETWRSNTPFVTRTVLSIQTVSYWISWFYNPTYALANIPHFTIFRFELYRLFTSPLVNTSLLNLVFAFMAFGDMGQRLERSLGSTAFGWLCLSIGGLTNVLFAAFCCLLYAIHDSETTYLFKQAGGIWLVLFGIIANECAQSPRSAKRRLFVVDVPVLYYPIVLLVFFTLLGGDLSWAYLLSMAIGYAMGFGHLEWTRLSAGRVKQLEEGLLVNWTRREGWVAGSAASGSGAWSEDTSSDASSGMGAGLFRMPARGDNHRDEEEAIPLTSAVVGGQTLGGGQASPRGNAETARAARLRALEQ